MKLEFEFELDQSVTTIFGEKGIIMMLGFDEGGKQYYVKTKTNSQWFKEKELKQP